MEQTYLLTIISVTFNAANEVRKTLESLASQKIDDYIKIEYIVQDGCSKDNTIEIVKKYSSALKDKGIDLFINCKKDKGIYDAMNKGIEVSHGKWICLLNAGDTFLDAYSIDKLVPYLQESKADVLYSDYKRSNKYMNRVVTIPDINLIRDTMIFCHQAVFIRDSVYKKEKYDLKYKMVADYDLMLRLYLKEYFFQHINDVLLDYDTEGVSAINMVDTYKEIRQVKLDQGILQNSITEKIHFKSGVVKRLILGKMSQELRWKLYRMIKRN